MRLEAVRDLNAETRSARATALLKRSGAFDWSDLLGRHRTLESGVALRLPPQSKIDRGPFGLRRQSASALILGNELPFCVRVQRRGREVSTVNLLFPQVVNSSKLDFYTRRVCWLLAAEQE